VTPPWDGGFAKPATQSEGRYLSASDPWYQDISDAGLAPDSGTIIGWLQTNNVFGTTTNRLRTDFTMVVMDVPPGTMKRAFTQSSGYFTPDCDLMPVPVSPGGFAEGGEANLVFGDPLAGYACSGGDCHILFLSRAEGRLYELYDSSISAASFTSRCAVLFDAAVPYGSGRGADCVSADPAGLPIAPLLFTAEELATGHIDHALRFMLPNARIQQGKYVAPATANPTATGPATAPPLGARFRLRASYPLASLTPAARIVAVALQRYGMFLADTGVPLLSAQSDALSSTKWSSVGFDSLGLSALRPDDFEIVESGPLVDSTFSCSRTQLTQ